MATNPDSKVYDSMSDNDCMYDAISKLGYSKDIAEKQVKLIDNLEVSSTMITKRNYSGHEVHVVIPGSVGEGIGNLEVSDYDVLYVQRSILCFQNDPSVAYHRNLQAIYKIDTENAPPGYTWLESKTLPNADRTIHYNVFETLKKSTFSRNGKEYLRNDRFFVQGIEDNEIVEQDSGWLRKQFEFKDRSGPARPFNLSLPFVEKLSIDYVPAFPCLNPPIGNWYTKHRINDWPSKHLIDCIAQSEVFVVPVRRNDMDDNYWLQWRLSFTLAERALVRSFNDVQIKLYAAMKLLAKCHLKPVCEQISSYVVKNLIFWAFEETKCDALTQDNFRELLLQILGRMKKAFDEKRLSNYITPERNLFEDKISDNEFTDLQNQLDEVMTDVRKALFECPALQKKVQQKEEDLRILKWRALLEEVLFAIAAIPPEQCDKVEEMIHRAKSFLEVVMILLNEVIPIIRRENPHGFFDLLISMSNEEILQIAVEMYSRSSAR